MHVTFCFCSPRWPRPLFPSLFILDFEVNAGLALYSLPPFSSVFLYILRLSFPDEPHQELGVQLPLREFFFPFFFVFLLPSTYSHNEDSLDNFAYPSSLQPLKRIA